MKFIYALLLSVVLVVQPTLAFAQQTGPAGTVLRVPSSGGRATMGPVDLNSANATTNKLDKAKLGGFVQGECLFGGTSGSLNTEATSECFWDATGKSLSLGTSGAVTSAKMQIDSTTKGFLIPRMTEAQRNAIVGPANGLQVYNTTTNKLNVYANTAWSAVGSGSGSSTNQLQNGSFEEGFGAPWSYNNAVTPTLQTGTGATGAYDGTKYVTYNSGGASVSGVLFSQSVSAWGLSGLPVEGTMRVRARTAGLEVCTDITIANALPNCQPVPSATTGAKWEGVQSRLPAGAASGVVYIRKAVAGVVDFDLDDAYAGIDRSVNSFIDSAPIAIQRLSGAGTYAPSASTRYIKIRMVGGGGGGSGSGTSAGTGAGGGGTTTFGSLLSAFGGGGGVYNGTAGLGGTATITSPAFGFTNQGGSGGGAAGNTGASASIAIGGTGGVSPFGGGGIAGGASVVALNAVPGTGSGGGGGTASGAGTLYAGGGGAAGGYLEAILVAPTSVSYSVGNGGTAGAAGPGGQSGGSGASGTIIVEEYGYAGGTVYTPQAASWRVEAYLNAPSGATVGNATRPFGEIGATDMNLVPGSGSAAVGITCVGGTATPGTLNCNAQGVAESNGITFNAPETAIYEICATATSSLDVSSGADVSRIFAIAETASNNTTEIQRGYPEGTIRFTNYNNTGTNNRTQQDTACAALPLNQGQRTARFIWSQSIGAGSIIYSGVFSTRWKVTQLSKPITLPIIVGPNIGTVNVTGNYTILPSDQIITADATSAAVTLTLPNAATAGKGKVIEFTKIDSTANHAIVNAISGQSIGPTGLGFTSTRLVGPNDYIALVSDGVSTWNWKSSNKRSVTVIGSGASGTSCSPAVSNPGEASNCVRSGVGSFVQNFTSGVFGSVNGCVANSHQAGSFIYMCRVEGQGPSGVGIICSNSSTGAPADLNFTFMCNGTR